MITKPRLRRWSKHTWSCTGYDSRGSTIVTIAEKPAWAYDDWHYVVYRKRWAGIRSRMLRWITSL